MIRLLCNDGVELTVDKKTIVNKSDFLSKMLEDYEDDDEILNMPIELPNVTSHILEKVIEFCNIGEPLGKINRASSADFYKMVPVVYADFMYELGYEDHIPLMEAADYLSMDDLIEVSCAFFLCRIYEKSPEEIRQMFGFEDDFTQEEKEAFSKEHEWVKQII